MPSAGGDQGEVAAFERAAKRSRMFKLGALFLVILSPLIWVGYKNVATRKHISERRDAYAQQIALTDADKKELPLALERARKALQNDDRTFAGAVAPEALLALVPSGQRCPHRVTAPSMGAGESYTKNGSIDMNYFGNADYRLFERAEDIKSSMRDHFATLAEIAEKLPRGQATKVDLEAAERLESGPAAELIVVGTLTKPSVHVDSYEPGTLKGHAYLYSYKEGRIVCVADLDVQNSASIEIEYRSGAGAGDEMINKDLAATSVLERDLHVQIRHGIASHLQAIP